MEFYLLSPNGILFLLRWVHFMAGVVWIGHLYYFNFVQGEFFKEIEPSVKNIATQKLVPKALWWFRWGAMVTFISGILLITGTMHTGVPLQSSWGVLILIGSLLGTFMWANVWFVIWPNQKVVIASANQVLSGGQPIPDAANRAARALVVSRTNVMFSIPLLFFMGAARHLIIGTDFSGTNFQLLTALMGFVILLAEMNGLKGKIGPLATVRGVIASGFMLTAILWGILRIAG